MPATNSAARRYADAVFEIAQTEGNLEGWERDLGFLAQVFGSQGVAARLSNPSVPALEKDAFIERELASTGQGARNLARLLVNRSRADLAGAILVAFRGRLDELRGIVHARVTTAVPLTDPERASIAERLAQMTGQQVTMEADVDPALLGGIVVRIGDKLIDGSAKARLLALKHRLAGTAR